MPVDRGGDQPHEADRPHETTGLRGRGGFRDLRLDPVTPEEMDFKQKVTRGELRFEGTAGWVEHEPYDHVKRRDRAEQMRDEVELPEKVRELPKARDVLPNLNWAEIDHRKFADYSMRLDHPQNGGKANGWRALGYDIDDPDARQEAARDLKDLISDELLQDGRIRKLSESEHGTKYQVQNGFIGPNGRHATLLTGWRVADEGERSYPRMNTVWVQPHKEKEDDR